MAGGCSIGDAVSCGLEPATSIALQAVASGCADFLDTGYSDPRLSGVLPIESTNAGARRAATFEQGIESDPISR